MAAENVARAAKQALPLVGGENTDESVKILTAVMLE